MKVFVYDKKDNRTIDIIDKVISVQVDNVSHTIYIDTTETEIIYDTRVVKTTA